MQTIILQHFDKSVCRQAAQCSGQQYSRSTTKFTIPIFVIQHKFMAKQVEDFDANLAGDEGKTEETRTRWFKRIKKGILTSTSEKKETKEGLWTKCPGCNFICTVAELRESLFVCPKCEYHHRIGSAEYFDILFDEKQ